MYNGRDRVNRDCLKQFLKGYRDKVRIKDTEKVLGMNLKGGCSPVRQVAGSIDGDVSESLIFIYT